MLQRFLTKLKSSLACRNDKLGRDAINYIKKECKAIGKDASVDYIQLDLSSFESIRLFASKIKKQNLKIDLLVNNAGVMFTPNYKTSEGHEVHFGVNYLGHFCLTFELLPLLVKNRPSRILNLTSDTYTMGVVNSATIRGENFHRWWSYCNSKLAIVIGTLTFQKKLKELGIEDVHVLTVNPGVVSTNITRTSLRILQYLYDLQFVRKYFGFQTPREGSSSSIYAALSDDVLKHKDKLVDFTCEMIEINEKAKDPEIGMELWNSSQEFVGKTLKTIIETECN